MKKQKIKIRTLKKKGPTERIGANLSIDDYEWTEELGYLAGNHWAVTEKPGGWYAITHVPTGARLLRVFNDVQYAIAAAKEIDALEGVDWSRDDAEGYTETPGLGKRVNDIVDRHIWQDEDAV